jgi:hypothetical protein
MPLPVPQQYQGQRGSRVGGAASITSKPNP